jgi:NSS family neurotransmitter:Na+ symporter
MANAAWKTKLGFYFLALGAAFGMGNVWRFPYVVAENGGGAFILIYILLVVVLGMPLLICELMLGKLTRSSLIRSFAKVKSNPELAVSSPVASWVPSNVYLGRLSLLICILVLSYFSVLSGWVLYYIVRFGFALLGQSVEIGQSFGLLMNSGTLQIAFTFVHFLVVIYLVAKDFDEGIELWAGRLVPLFAFLLIILASQSLSLTSAEGALRQFFYPDFSKLKLSSLGAAVGHVMFTLTIGFGTMVTFGSYLQEKVSTTIAGFRVATIDSLVSILAGLMMFPLIGMTDTKRVESTLMFEYLPQLFNQIDNGLIYGFGFFCCLYLAAVGTSVALLETVVSNLKDTFTVKRSKAAWIVGLLTFLISMIPALSSSQLSALTFRGRGVLAIIDIVLVNWCLPLLALWLSQFVANRIQNKAKEKEFAALATVDSQKIFLHWLFLIKYGIPFIIITGLLLQFLDIFY